MHSRNRLTDPRILLQVGMACLLVFNLLHYLSPWVDDSMVDSVEGLSGVALGAAMGLLLRSARTRGREHRGRGARPCV